MTFKLQWLQCHGRLKTNKQKLICCSLTQMFLYRRLQVPGIILGVVTMLGLWLRRWQAEAIM